AVVVKALQRPREDRYQSAAELGQALEEIVHRLHCHAESSSALMIELFPDVTSAPGGSDEMATRAGKHSGETALRSHIHLGRLARDRRWRAVLVAVAAVSAGFAAWAIVKPPPRPAAAAVAPAPLLPVTVHVTSVPAGA